MKIFEQLAWLRGTLDQLIPQAVKAANPRLYAEVVLDNLPPGLISEEELLKRLADEGWLAGLTQIDARVAQHAEWFGKFRAYAVKVLERRKRQAELAASTPQQHGLPGVNEPMQDGEGGGNE